MTIKEEIKKYEEKIESLQKEVIEIRRILRNYNIRINSNESQILQMKGVFKDGSENNR